MKSNKLLSDLAKAKYEYMKYHMIIINDSFQYIPQYIQNEYNRLKTQYMNLQNIHQSLLNIEKRLLILQALGLPSDLRYLIEEKVNTKAWQYFYFTIKNEREN